MLRKHAARFSTQWDCYLSGVLWAYTPHESTGFLMFGMDLQTPPEETLLPSTPQKHVKGGTTEKKSYSPSLWRENQQRSQSGKHNSQESAPARLGFQLVISSMAPSAVVQDAPLSGLRPSCSKDD